MWRFFPAASFVENSYLCFERAVIDGACKDKNRAKFDAMFKLEIFFHSADGESLNDDFENYDQNDGGADGEDSDDED
jgi:hypothetical protein